MTYTNKQQVLRKLGYPPNTSLSIKELAEILDLPEEALQEVYNRGTGAWKSSLSSVRLKKDYSKNPDTARYPRSARLSKEQWSFARVYAFINKSKKVFYGADADIARKYNLG
jgi:hypothetical protein